MKRAIILLALFAIVFVVVLSTSGNSADTRSDASADPPDYMQVLGALTAPFAPKLAFPSSTITVQRTQKLNFQFGPSKDRLRIATFLLQTGPLARIAFCATGSTCSDQSISKNRPACLVQPHTAQPPGCQDRKTPGPKASVIALSDGGTLTIEAGSGDIVIALH